MSRMRHQKKIRRGGTSLSVPVPHLLFAKRAFDAAGNRISEPDDGSKKDNSKRELKSVNHESSP